MIEFKYHQTLVKNDQINHKLSKSQIIKWLHENHIIYLVDYYIDKIKNSKNQPHKFDIVIPGYHLILEFKTQFYYKYDNAKKVKDDKINQLSNSSYRYLVIDLCDKNTNSQSVIEQIIELTSQKYRINTNSINHYDLINSQLASRVYQYDELLIQHDMYDNYVIPTKLYYEMFNVMHSNHLIQLPTYEEFMNVYRHVLVYFHNIKSLKPSKNNAIKSQVSDIDYYDFNFEQWNQFKQTVFKGINRSLQNYYNLNVRNISSPLYYNNAFDPRSSRSIKVITQYMDAIENQKRLDYLDISNVENKGQLYLLALEKVKGQQQHLRHLSNKSLIEKFKLG